MRVTVDRNIDGAGVSVAASTGVLVGSGIRTAVGIDSRVVSHATSPTATIEVTNIVKMTAFTVFLGIFHLPVLNGLEMNLIRGPLSVSSSLSGR